MMPDVAKEFRYVVVLSLPLLPLNSEKLDELPVTKPSPPFVLFDTKAALAAVKLSSNAVNVRHFKKFFIDNSLVINELKNSMVFIVFLSLIHFTICTVDEMYLIRS
jgi:hypothetical protein